MTAPARAYFVDGVQLVNVGGELCNACEQRPGVGRSIGGAVMCARCAGWYAQQAEGLAEEREASARRREYQRSIDSQKIRFITEHLTANIPSREVARRVAVARAAKASNHARAGTTPQTFACGHDRTRRNTYSNAAGRKFCRECRNKVSREAKEKARRREQIRMGRAQRAS